MNKRNTVTKEQVDEILSTAETQTIKILGKPATLVGIKFPNGFVLVETSICVDPKNYDEEIGKSVCLEHLEPQVWKLLGFNLQTELAKTNENLKQPKFVEGDLFKDADFISK